VSDIYDVMDPWSEIVETGATPPVDICERLVTRELHRTDHGVPNRTNLYPVPIFKYLPDWLSAWRLKAQHVRNLELKLYGRLVDEVRERRKHGIDRGCLIDKVLDEQSSNPLLTDEQLAYIGGCAIFRLAPPPCL
jgi:cytochrome P450 family 619